MVTGDGSEGAGGPEQTARPGAGGDVEPPRYTKYRSRPRLLRRHEEGNALEELRRETLRRSRGGRGAGPRKPLTFGRAVRWVAGAIAVWLTLSLVLFLISAQIESSKASGETERALAGGFPLASKSTILVLGSDARTASHAERGAQTIGAPSRSDSILLVRTGGGASARLSIPRDTVVDIPGHGREKINAAYAIGGAPLAIETIENYLHITINHVVEVDFANFPKLIDAMGGIDYTGGCVVSRINGGSRNGGYTLRLKPGTTHIDGKQALALARTRKNSCNPSESDLTRARRQQKIFAAMKSRLLSPTTFVRLPWVSWQAPKAIKSDMSGPSLLGLFASMAVGGSPPTRILRPYGGVTLPGGGAGLLVSDSERRSEVRRFLRG
ncbi:MAG TPA: LCP family protein [Solirubrobacteraceae bacterium]|nr:LCP family protein [Solirubrobacteraceae bacterium]